MGGAPRHYNGCCSYFCQMEPSGLADTTAQVRNSFRITSAVARGLRESAIIALGVVALVVFTALVSYSPDDPGFSFTGNSSVVHNRIGPIGAWVADVLFFLFGRPAFLFPVMLGGACWLLFRRDKTEQTSKLNTAVRIAGFVLVLVTSCGLVTLHWDAGSLRQTAGGVVGSLVGKGLASGLDFLGATLLMMAAWMAGLSLAFHVSWFTIMDRIGAAVWDGISWLRSRSATKKDVAEGRERKQARKEAVKTDQKKTGARTPPRIEPPTPIVQKSERVEKERQVELFAAVKANELPPLNLLDDPPPHEPAYSAEALEALSRLVEMKLKDFGIEAEVVAVQPGPVVTRFELRPAPGVKASQITSLQKDLARALSVLSVRVQEVIPGKSVMGLEIANEKREVVTLGEILRSKAYDETNSPIALALGKDIGGQPMVADLARMPHLLIAGTTGSGKSGCINTILTSILLRATPDDVRMILIDPKRIELGFYESIPHLLTPVVSSPKTAAAALANVVGEMERRYERMSHVRARSLPEMNRTLRGRGEKQLPYLLVVIDELADLMMISPQDVEDAIIRLAQKSRAVGIHLVLATQRPSVDVITGMIKANVPSRIAFAVASQTDSRVILDQAGAESLLGQGDMLFKPLGTSRLQRVQGAYVSEEEVALVVEQCRAQREQELDESMLEAPEKPSEDYDDQDGDFDPDEDPLLEKAIEVVVQAQTASVSLLQRRLRVGYTRAGRLIDMLERRGIISPYEGSKPRRVLVGETETLAS